MNNPLLALALILLTMGAIGYLQKYPIPIGAIRGRLSKFNQWVINGGALEASVFCGLCGLLVAVITWPWSY